MPPTPPMGMGRPEYGACGAPDAEVYDNEPEARARGERAASDVAQTHSLEAAGHSMKLRLESLRARTLIPARKDDSGHLDGWSPRLDESRSLRSRLSRYLARNQLDVIYARIDELREQLGDSRAQLAELRLERNLDAERADSEMALLQAKVLMSLRRQSGLHSASLGDPSPGRR